LTAYTALMVNLRTAMRGGFLSIVIAALLVSRVAYAGDRVADLAKVLETSSNDKTRLAAVIALAKLEDKRALKPLVGALADPNPQIRAVACAGLGKLGHKAALPQLKNTAVDDLDETVRDKAKEAATAVAKANQLPDPWPSEAVAEDPSARGEKKTKRAKAGFGNTPHAIEAEGADTYVRINSSMDDSPGKADKKTRLANAEILRTFLTSQFRANPLVSMDDAQKPTLTARHLDVSVTKLDVVTGGTHVEVEAQLRLAISDANGKMLSFVSGGAKVQVPRNKFNPKYMPNMRRDALEGAMRGLYDKLLTQLRDRSQS
jgi:HEAT repeats